MDKKKIIKPVLAVCFVVLCGAGYLWIRGMGQGKEQIVLEKASEDTRLQEESGDGPGKVPTKTGGEAAEEPRTTEAADVRETPVYVHVCGAVVSEGVYALQPGSRVSDGIAAAGGFSETADTTYHNLAALLSDGQKVYVPTVEETKTLSVPERAASSDENEAGGVLSGETGTKKVNLNTAGLEELMTLSGIGEAKAKRILQYREKVGPFQSIEEIKNVSGIGDAMFERVRESIIVE